MIMQHLTDVELAKAIVDATLAENASFRIILPRFRSSVINAQLRVQAAIQHQRFETTLLDHIAAVHQAAEVQKHELQAEQARRAAEGRPPVAVHFEPDVATRTIAASQALTDETLFQMERVKAGMVIPNPVNDTF